MGFNKEIELADGTTGSYWRVSKLTNDLVNKHVGIELALYKSHAAYKAGKQPIKLPSPVSYGWSGEDYPFTSGKDENQLKIVYEKLKTSKEVTVDDKKGVAHTSEVAVDGQFINFTDAKDITGKDKVV